MSYCAVSPRTLPVVEYNMRFKENLQIVSLVLIAPVIISISVFDAKESDINRAISTFTSTFTLGYVMCFVCEVVWTTILRLSVFLVWEPQIFKLTPRVPMVVLPWVLRENKYRPKRITLFAADFATSCVAAPIIEEYIKLKERILLLERVVLHTIGFELDIHHPYKFLVDQIKKLTQARALEYASPPPGDGGSGGGKASSSSHKMTQELVQYGMNFANDSLHTTLCLQFPARVVAAACAYLACRMCKVRPVRGQGWPDLLGVPAEDLASISVQLMELIAEKKGCDLAVFKDIRADLDAMTGGTGGDGGPAKRPRTN